jgi:hypothetical protein
MSEIPSPGELGLNIPSWRSGQEEMIHVTVTSEKRVVTVCAPTGFGKSDAVIASSLISGEPTCIVTDSRGLQDQYMKVGQTILVALSLIIPVRKVMWPAVLIKVQLLVHLHRLKCEQLFPPS